MILPNFKDFPRLGRLLGIDWGARRMGVAVSDERQEFVFTRPQIESMNAGPAFATRVMEIIRDERVVGIVIGLPIRGDGSESDTTQAVRHAAAEIATYTDLPIIFIDENLTSMEAGEYLIGLNRNDLKKKLDSQSAKVILENAIALLRRHTK